MSTRLIQIELLLDGFTNPSTGLPVNAGTAYFYEAGTTTAKAVYTEKEGSNGYTSYTLDANGGAQLYGEGNYRVVIQDSEGATVDTKENLRLEFPNYYVHTIIANYTQLSNDDFLFVNTTAGAITITGLAAASWLRPLKIMRIAGANAITFDPNGTETIDAAATLTISSNAIVEIVSDGSNLRSAGIRSSFIDADGDTKIQVEEAADEDIIRFDTGGTERATITSTKVTSTVPIQVNSHQDTDADTKVQVEESADEDKVRIDTGGTERIVIDSSGLDVVSGALLIGGTNINATVANLTNKTSADGFRITGGNLTIRPSSGANAVITGGTTAETEVDILAGGFTSSNDSGALAVRSKNHATLPGTASLYGTDGTTGVEGLRVLTSGTTNLLVGLQIGGVAVTATPAEINAAADGIGVSIPKVKFVSIGAWDMDATASVSIAHGVAGAATKIVGVTAAICNGSEATFFVQPYDGNLRVSWTSTNVTITRTAFGDGGDFDNPAYNDTGINRGYITVFYID